MKILVAIVISMCVANSAARANQDCIWTSSKAGLTVCFRASCDFENLAVLDSIVDGMASKLNRPDTSLKIAVFVNFAQLSVPNAKYCNFLSIGYDTLRPIDDDYIFDYYWAKENRSMERNGGMNFYETSRIPLDINASRDKSRNDLGVKIIYDKDYRLGRPDWSDVSKASLYAANNIEFIKQHQVRDTVRYNTNGWYLSLVTLDSSAVNNALGRTVAKHFAQIKPTATTNYFYFMLLGVAVLLMAGWWLLTRR